MTIANTASRKRAATRTIDRCRGGTSLNVSFQSIFQSLPKSRFSISARRRARLSLSSLGGELFESSELMRAGFDAAIVQHRGRQHGRRRCIKPCFLLHRFITSSRPADIWDQSSARKLDHQGSGWLLSFIVYPLDGLFVFHFEAFRGADGRSRCHGLRHSERATL